MLGWETQPAIIFIPHNAAMRSYFFRRKTHTLKERRTWHDIIVGVTGRESSNFFKPFFFALVCFVFCLSFSPGDKNDRRLRDKKETCKQSLFFFTACLFFAFTCFFIHQVLDCWCCQYNRKAQNVFFADISTHFNIICRPDCACAELHRNTLPALHLCCH